jgi:hypothetical protein
LGFNPTDDGYILAQSYRVLHGQIPHRDFISVRPAGSPLFHTLDFLLPMPLLDASRLVTTIEMVLTALLWGCVIFRRWPNRWRVWEGIAVAASALVSIHAFPLMDWHTVDGLLFVSLGLALLFNSKRATFGLLILGASIVFKQSFFLAPIIGIVIVTMRASSGERSKAAIRSLLLAAIPGAAYLIVMLVLGALPSFVGQMVAANADAFTGHIFKEMLVPSGLAVGAGVVALLVGLTVCDSRQSRLVGTLVRSVITLFVLGIALQQHLEIEGTWAIRLEEIAGIVVAWGMIIRRELDWPGIALLAVGWMTSLSWGYINPNLIGGALGLLAIQRVWFSVEWQTGSKNRQWDRRNMVVTIVASVVAFSVITAQWIDTRHTQIYRDTSIGQLTFHLDRLSPDFGSVRTNQSTGTYLEDIKICVERMPAHYVAVLPDNPGIYPLFHLDDPFPLDWILPNELASDGARIIQTAKALHRQGDYLVLFQTQEVSGLANEGLNLSGSRILSHHLFGGSGVSKVALKNDLVALKNDLDGRQRRCGPFVGVYQPQPASK